MQVRYQAALRPEGADYISQTGMQSWSRRVEGLLVHEVDGEFVLLDVHADRVHQLNRTASAIWRELDAASDAQDIARRLVDEFEVEWDCALNDVRGVLDQFEALSLIVRRTRTG